MKDYKVHKNPTLTIFWHIFFLLQSFQLCVHRKIFIFQQICTVKTAQKFGTPLFGRIKCKSDFLVKLPHRLRYSERASELTLPVNSAVCKSKSQIRMTINFL